MVRDLGSQKQNNSSLPEHQGNLDGAIWTALGLRTGRNVAMFGQKFSVVENTSQGGQDEAFRSPRGHLPLLFKWYMLQTAGFHFLCHP